MADPIKVLIVDDHPVIREGITSMLKIEHDIVVVGEASNTDEVLARMEEFHPDVVLVDLGMPGTDEMELTRLIKSQSPASEVIVLTLFDQYLAESKKAGAKGYLPKDVNLEELVDVIQRVHSGEEFFHPDLLRRTGTEYDDNAKETPGVVEVAEIAGTYTGVTTYHQVRVFVLPPASIRGSLSLTSIVEEAVKGEFKQVEGTVSEGFAITFDLEKPLSIKEIHEKVSTISYIEIPGEEEMTGNSAYTDLLLRQQTYNTRHPAVKTVFVRIPG